MANTSGIRAGRAYVELGANDAQLMKALRRAQKRMRAFASGISSLGGKLAAGGGAMLTPFAVSTKVFLKAGDQLDKMAKRTGFTVESLSELGFAAEQTGSDITTLEKGVRRMQQTVNDAGRGLSTATDALDAIGLSVDSLVGLSPEEQFKLIADSISRIEDPSERAAIALQIFGRAGAMLIPLLSGGSKGMEELQQQARDLGLTISTETAGDAAELTDELNILRRVLRAGAIVIGSAVAPAISKMTKLVTRAVVYANEWVRANKATVATVFKVAGAVTVAGFALIGLGAAVFVASATLGALATIVGVATTVIAAILSPIGLVTIAVAALGATILVWSGAGGEAIVWLMDRFGELRAFVDKVVGGISDALAAGDIALAAKILWLGLRAAWETGSAELNKVWLKARQFFLENILNMAYGAQVAFEIGTSAIASAWIDLTAWLSSSWTEFTSAFENLWLRSVNFFKKGWNEIRGLVDDGFDAESANKDADAALQSKLDSINADRDKKLADREQIRKDSQDFRRKEQFESLKKIGSGFEDSLAIIDAITKVQTAKTKKALEDARRELDQAIEDARAKREASDAEGGPDRAKLPTASDIEDLLRRLGNMIKDKVEARGTFNANAFQSLAGASSTEERAAKAAEATAKNTKRIADAARGGGLVFT